MPTKASKPRQNGSASAIVLGMTLEEFLEALGVSSLDDVDSDAHPRIPSSVVDDMKPAERKRLNDPDWIEADEFEVMMSNRAFVKSSARGTPLRDSIRSRGFDVKD